jgi:hypothetical protein
MTTRTRPQHPPHGLQGSDRRPPAAGCDHAGAPVVMRGGRAYLVCPSCDTEERICLSWEEWRRDDAGASASACGCGCDPSDGYRGR